uniref:Lysosome-associated membrane glycoprotein 1 n=1 Tax=Ciona savignyi TaxID=51511 RepID=H2YJ67_CIOSA
MFPNAKDVNKVYKFSQTALAEMSTPLNHSYLCNTVETDVLVNVTSNVILRITGVKLQAFDVMNRTYSKSQKCFSDQELPTANVGNWTVKSNNSVCSMYMFSATANITYMTLLGKTATARIPLDNSTKTKVDGDCHFGSDGISFFWVKMEEVTFNFFFNRTNTGSKFNYYLFNVHISYNTNSKYFPNHAYLDDGNDVVSNSSLRLFESDQDHSYKCSAQTTIMLNKTAGHVTFKDVQVQPFGIEKNNGVFSAADDCNVDDLSPIVPIIVGAVLAGLIVIVVVAYFIGRKRSRKPEYETI